MTQRNLIYHIYPLRSNDIWKRNVRQLKRYWGTFTGRKLIGVATDENTATIEEVQAEFDVGGIEWFPIDNNRIKRDGATLEKLLPLLKDEPGITFVAHAKGVSTVSSPQGVERWRNVMYYTLLSDPEHVDERLRNVSCVGTHRNICRGKPLDFPDGTKAQWHFAGGFWWVDNATLFARGDWRVPLEEKNTGWLAETYLPLVFGLKESACLAYDDWQDDIYDPKMYPPLFDDRESLPANGFATDNLPNKLIIDRDSDYASILSVCRGESRLPFADNSLDYVCLDNVLQELVGYHGLLHEICRVLRMCGALDIIVPHYGHQLAHAYPQVISPLLVEQWCTDQSSWFNGQPRRLYLEHTDRAPSKYFDQAKKLYPKHTDEELYAYVPNTCESIRFRLVVGINREQQ